MLVHHTVNILTQVMFGVLLIQVWSFTQTICPDPLPVDTDGVKDRRIFRNQICLTRNSPLWSEKWRRQSLQLSFNVKAICSINKWKPFISMNIQ